MLRRRKPTTVTTPMIRTAIVVVLGFLLQVSAWIAVGPFPRRSAAAVITTTHDTARLLWRGQKNRAAAAAAAAAAGNGNSMVVGSTPVSRSTIRQDDRRRRPMPRCLWMRNGEEEEEQPYYASDPNDDDDNTSSAAPECTIQNLEDCVNPERREQVRMEAVRMLQDSFYQSSSSTSYKDDGDDFWDATQEDDRTKGGAVVEPTMANGGVLQLPLWRVPWTEVPGRTNVLSVHEPMYTNMFEELIRSQEKSSSTAANNNDTTTAAAPAWYFGHLYVPKDNNHPSNRCTTIPLHSYADIIEIDVSDDERSAAVLGTLMKITDYRRMEDGKLLLLVQAVERFVVMEILQEKPYGRARVQLLPDREEIQLPPFPTTTDSSNRSRSSTTRNPENTTPPPPFRYTEQMVQPARASAVVESWQQWHPYEYESTPFPLPSEAPFITIDQVVGSALAKVLPYAPFDTRHLPTDRLLKPPKMVEITDHTNTNNVYQSQSSSLSSSTAVATDHQDADAANTVAIPPPQKPLEVCLLEAGILNDTVEVPDALLRMPLGELEINLWLVLNDYLVQSRTPVSPVLLGLMPVGQSWPSKFVLERIADAIQSTGLTASSSSSSSSNNNNKIEHKYRRVSPLYPSLRRQKRLAYCAAQLLERRRETDHKNELRQKLLQIPSTKLRLAYILWMFETENGAWM